MTRNEGGGEMTDGVRPSLREFRDEFVAPGDSILDLLERANRVCGHLASTPINDTVVPSLVRRALERAQALKQSFPEAIRDPESSHYIENLETRYGR